MRNKSGVISVDVIITPLLPSVGCVACTLFGLASLEAGDGEGRCPQYKNKE
jgi:hypothetical protein